MKPNIVYGYHVVEELLHFQAENIIEIVIYDTEKKEFHALERTIKKYNIKFRKIFKKQEFEEPLLRSFRESISHQNIYALVKPYKYFSLKVLLEHMSEKSVVLLLNNITDVANFGAIIRSAVAFGVDCIIIPKNRSVEVTAQVYKTSAGLLSRAKICQENISAALRVLKSQGYWVFAADAQAKKSLDELDLPQKLALVLGAENKGISPGVLKEVDDNFCIPLAEGIDSLNVSASAAIILYHCSRN